MRRTPLRRSPCHVDPVSNSVYIAVIARDGGCVARTFPYTVLSAGPCRGRLTLDHVKDQPMMGKRAPSDAAHLVTLCSWHHLESGWATSHRPELRAYLRGVRDCGHVDPVFGCCDQRVPA